MSALQSVPSRRMLLVGLLSALLLSLRATALAILQQTNLTLLADPDGTWMTNLPADF